MSYSEIKKFDIFYNVTFFFSSIRYATNLKNSKNDTEGKDSEESG
jgi:hypothetical protein